MHAAAQQHHPRHHVANWRLCWRELMYITLHLCSAHAAIYWQVLTSRCLEGPAPGSSQLDAGAIQLVMAKPSTSPPRSWAQQLLCLSMLHRNSGTGHPPSVTWRGRPAMWLLQPFTFVLLQVLDHVLAMLVRPWLLLVLLHDPHYLCHLVCAALVTACIIWPALRGRRVSTLRRTATATTLRLLYSVTTLISAHLPGGLFRHHFTSTLVGDGRWKLSVGVAWCHGLLLQAPLGLQMPLCLLDWAVAAYVGNLIDSDLHVPPRGWAQHCMDGLLIVGLPLAAALVVQATPHASCGSAMPCHPSQTLSDSKPGASSSGSAGEMQQQHPGPAAPPGLSQPPTRMAAASQPAPLRRRGRSQQSGSTAPVTRQGAAGLQQGMQSHVAGAAGAPGQAAATPAAMQLPATPRLPAPTSGASTFHQQRQLLPALLAACPPEGWRELPTECWYTPVTRLVPMNFKVAQPEGVEYAAAAVKVTAAAQEVLSQLLQPQQVVTQLVTVPGCVLLLMEVVQPAAAEAAAAGGEDVRALEQELRPALLGGTWPVELATPAAGSPEVQADGMAVMAGGSGDGRQLPLNQLQEHITRLLHSPTETRPLHTPNFIDRAVTGSGPLLPATPVQSSTSRWPCSTCIIGTWGQPLELQLSSEGSWVGAGLPLPTAVRVVVTHLQQVLLDDEVALEAPDTSSDRDSSSSSAVTTSLVLICQHLGNSVASAAGDSRPCALTVNILPVPAAQAPSSATPTRAALPLAHITLLLLPPDPAAELAGWVAAHQLPAAHVASWGRDLAVLVGCGERLTAARTSPHPLEASPAAAGGGGGSSSKQDLLALCRLSVLAAGQLEQLFSGCGLVCAADLVAVAKQRVLVGATSLQPMAAGSVVPAAGGVHSAERVEAACKFDAGASSISVIVAVALFHSPLNAAPPAALGGAPAARCAGGLVEVVAVAYEDPCNPTPASSSRSSSGNIDGMAAHVPTLESGAELELSTDAPPSRGPSHSSSTSSTTKARSSDGSFGPLVSPQEAAAVAGVGLAAWRVCWRGFQGPGAEAAFQAYRGGALRRWDWVCRLYVWVLGAGLVAKKMQVLDVPLASWSGAPAWLIQLEVTVHVLLLGLAPRWWARHRDAVLASYHARVGALWLWEALAWPLHTFRAIYGTSSRLTLIPVSFMVMHKRPWANVLACAVVCPLGFATLLLQAHAGGDCGGLDGALYRGIQGSSWLLVVAGWVFCASNLLLALVCSMVVEVRVRRAWARDQATQPPQQQGQQAATPPAAGSSQAVRATSP